AREVVIFLDCCYSGRAGVLTSFDPSKAILRKGLSIISSSSSNQPSVQKGNQGIFTSILCEALNGGAADILGETNISSIYAYVAKLLKAWDQNPILKSHIWRLVSLRKCKPLIEPDILRRLITYFPKDDHFFKLDSSYAPSAEPSNHQHEMIFADLQKFVTLGLVDPVGDDHLYFAAIHDEGCELTPLGIFYWNRALKQSF
ncbi:MAG: caspase family protein, partial [Cyanobacteria bacterium J06649_11]